MGASISLKQHSIIKAMARDAWTARVATTWLPPELSPRYAKVGPIGHPSHFREVRVQHGGVVLERSLSGRGPYHSVWWRP